MKRFSVLLILIAALVVLILGLTSCSVSPSEPVCSVELSFAGSGKELTSVTFFDTPAKKAFIRDKVTLYYKALPSSSASYGKEEEWTLLQSSSLLLSQGYWDVSIRGTYLDEGNPEDDYILYGETIVYVNLNTQTLVVPVYFHAASSAGTLGFHYSSSSSKSYRVVVSAITRDGVDPNGTEFNTSSLSDYQIPLGTGSYLVRIYGYDEAGKTVVAETTSVLVLPDETTVIDGKHSEGVVDEDTLNDAVGDLPAGGGTVEVDDQIDLVFQNQQTSEHEDSILDLQGKSPVNIDLQGNNITIGANPDKNITKKQFTIYHLDDGENLTISNSSPKAAVFANYDSALLPDQSFVVVDGGSFTLSGNLTMNGPNHTDNTTVSPGAIGFNGCSRTEKRSHGGTVLIDGASIQGYTNGITANINQGSTTSTLIEGNVDIALRNQATITALTSAIYGASIKGEFKVDARNSSLTAESYVIHYKNEYNGGLNSTGDVTINLENSTITGGSAGIVVEYSKNGDKSVHITIDGSTVSAVSGIRIVDSSKPVVIDVKNGSHIIGTDGYGIKFEKIYAPITINLSGASTIEGGTGTSSDPGYGLYFKNSLGVFTVNISGESYISSTSTNAIFYDMKGLSDKRLIIKTTNTTIDPISGVGGDIKTGSSGTMFYDINNDIGSLSSNKTKNV
ncbi:MAG: hypothetical protein KBS81_11235 [Spirochaetales bacterium]|nr:hypothetical protein [Candidatus Physcosoma equi]